MPALLTHSICSEVTVLPLIGQCLDHPTHYSFWISPMLSLTAGWTEDIQSLYTSVSSSVNQEEEHCIPQVLGRLNESAEGLCLELSLVHKFSINISYDNSSLPKYEQCLSKGQCLRVKMSRASWVAKSRSLFLIIPGLLAHHQLRAEGGRWWWQLVWWGHDIIACVQPEQDHCVHRQPRSPVERADLLGQMLKYTLGVHSNVEKYLDPIKTTPDCCFLF